jgi:hypothetical protein
MTDPLEAIGDLVEGISVLTRQAVSEYTHIVDSIVRTRSRDVRHIDDTLDGLLDFCFDAEALRLFKKLWRHYYFIDPVATRDYVHIYRKIWNSEPEVRP